MPKRETAAEREARYAAELQADIARFEAEKPLRFLRVLARVQSHGFATYFYCDENSDDVVVRIKGFAPYHDLNQDMFYSKLNEVQMSNIEYDIDELDSALKEKQRLADLKETALSKLTKEEQQLLGLI